MNEAREKIIIPDDDDKLLELCNVETYRASGPGGQHVNTTDSAVRLTFKPENIVVTCQKERSQYLNKLECLKKLRAKIAQLNYRKPKRIATKLSWSKKLAGLEQKARHGVKKKLRGPVDF